MNLSNELAENYDKSETWDKSGLPRTNLNRTESVKEDDSAFELLIEPTLQEENIGDASQASGLVTTDYPDINELDGEVATVEPAVCIEKTKSNFLD